MDAVVESRIIKNQYDITGGPFTSLDGGDPSQNVTLKIRLECKEPAKRDDGHSHDC